MMPTHEDFNMFQAINAMWTTIITLFTAVNRVAQSLDNVAQVGEIMSEEYCAVAKLERAAKIKQLKAEAAK